MSFPLAILQAIKAEIQTDPASVGYAGQSAGTQAALMNAPRSQSPQVFAGLNIGPQQIALVLIRRSAWEAVVTAANTSGAAGHADAFRLVQLANLATVSDDFSGGAMATLITNLVTAGVISAADRIAILAVARQEVFRSRAQVLGLDSVGQGDVEAALAS